MRLLLAERGRDLPLGPELPRGSHEALPTSCAPRAVLDDGEQSQEGRRPKWGEEREKLLVKEMNKCQLQARVWCWEVGRRQRRGSSYRFPWKLSGGSQLEGPREPKVPLGPC